MVDSNAGKGSVPDLCSKKLFEKEKHLFSQQKEQFGKITEEKNMAVGEVIDLKAMISQVDNELKESKQKLKNVEKEISSQANSMQSKVNLIIIALVVVALIQSFTLVGVTIYWSCVRGAKLRGHEPTLSVTTDSIFSRDVDVMPKGFEKFGRDENGTKYVGSASDILTALSHAAVANHYNGDATPETIAIHYNLPDECKNVSDRPWIKMTLPDKLEALEDPDLNVEKVLWNSASEGSQDNDVPLYDAEAGAVEIQKDGNYFVTSQIVAECPKEQENVTRIDNPLKIHIILESDEFGYSCVLQNARSKCDQVGEYNVVSSSIGAVFKLNMHDRLFVAVSNQNMTNLADKSNNYFAVYAL